MRKKTLVINNCADCPHFDNYYHDYNEECLKLNEIIPHTEIGVNPIPKNCPLKDAEEVE